MPDTPQHHLVPGSFFTSEQWAGLGTHIERLSQRSGGVLLISVEIEPDRRNYPTVAFGVFDAGERKALKSALEACRRRREKSHDVARGDLAAESEGAGSGK